MQTNIREVTEQFEQAEVTLSAEGLQDMRNECLDMLKAITLDAGRCKVSVVRRRKKPRQRQLLGL